MNLNDKFKSLAQLFCGDIIGFYSYKSAPQLINFFNIEFGFEDVYSSGFVTRWRYVCEKIEILEVEDKLNLFINKILDNRFIMRDCNLSLIQSIKKRSEILEYLNREYMIYGYKIIGNNNQFSFINEAEDLEKIGEGGFAFIYKCKSNGLVVKKLQEEFMQEEAIKSRFKREFKLMKSLNDIAGIIEVYNFDLDNYSYTMEYANKTLYNLILQEHMDEYKRIEIICNILNIISKVHDRNVIHRDLSPLNILIVDDKIKISDFGIGKSLDIESTHKTMYTNQMGQYLYCAPEQFISLKETDKRSDVFSLGKIINFIMTKDCNNTSHFLRGVAQKATSQIPIHRYKDCTRLYIDVKKYIKHHLSSEKKNEIENMINDGQYNSIVEKFIYELEEEKLCKYFVKNVKFREAIHKFIEVDNEKALYILLALNNNFGNICSSWGDYDCISNIAFIILNNDESIYIAKEFAANLLNYVAKEINRFDAQGKIKTLISKGMEPLIEELLNK